MVFCILTILTRGSLAIALTDDNTSAPSATCRILLKSGDSGIGLSEQRGRNPGIECHSQTAEPPPFRAGLPRPRGALPVREGPLAVVGRAGEAGAAGVPEAPASQAPPAGAPGGKHGVPPDPGGAAHHSCHGVCTCRGDSALLVQVTIHTKVIEVRFESSFRNYVDNLREQFALEEKLCKLQKYLQVDSTIKNIDNQDFLEGAGRIYLQYCDLDNQDFLS